MGRYGYSMNLEQARKWAREKQASGLFALVSPTGQIVTIAREAKARDALASFPGHTLHSLDEEVAHEGHQNPPQQDVKDDSSMDTVSALQALHVSALFRAAREVGFPVGRNGQHTKASLIVALTEAGKGEAVLAWLKEQAHNPPTTLPRVPALAPAPAPVPEGQAGALAQIIRDIAGQALNADGVSDLIEQALQAAEESGRFASNAPVYAQFAFPDSPPVTFDRLTHFQLPQLVRRLKLRHNVLLVGGAGSGKTTVVEDAAEVLGLPFRALSAVNFAHDLLGYRDAHGNYVSTSFREVYENGGVFLLDDCFGCAPDALLALNMALANSSCGFPDKMVKRHPDAIFVCGDNSDGSGASMQFSGRQRQDGAFLDRFTNIQWQIDPAIEAVMALGNQAWLAAVRAVRGFIKSRGIQDVAATPRAVSRGAQALRAGEDAKTVLESELKRGGLTEAWEQITSLPEVSSFLEVATSEF